MTHPKNNYHLPIPDSFPRLINTFLQGGVAAHRGLFFNPFKGFPFRFSVRSRTTKATLDTSIFKTLICSHELKEAARQPI
jgi:hypothetical protein